MASLVCPYCGRSLTRPVQAAVVACDGCEQQFDPGKVRAQPPALPRQAFGWVLLTVGIALLLPALSAALKCDFHDRDTPIRLVGIFLLPMTTFFVGLALKGGKVVVEESGPAAEPESDND